MILDLKRNRMINNRENLLLVIIIAYMVMSTQISATHSYTDDSDIINLLKRIEDLEKSNSNNNKRYTNGNTNVLNDNVNSKNLKPLGIGRDLVKTTRNLENEYIFQSVGNKIESFGSTLKELHEMIANINSTTSKTGRGLENIEFITKKFIKSDSCENNDKYKTIEKENLQLKIDLKISDSRIKDLEIKLLNSNEKLDNLKKVFH